MVDYDAQLSLTSWVLMAVVAVLLWYRNKEYDRIYSIYALIFGLILLILFGVQSGMDPDTAGRLAHTLIWVGIVLMLIMAYAITGTGLSAGVLLVMIIIIIFIIYMTFEGDSSIDITGRISDPPYWVSSKFDGYLLWILALGFIIPLLVLEAHSDWSNASCYLWIFYIIATAIIVNLTYKNASSISVWFYLLTVMILGVWVLGM